jgi:hypothetical protein
MTSTQTTTETTASPASPFATPQYESPYVSAYGSLRGSMESRLVQLLLTVDLLESTATDVKGSKWKVSNIRELATRMLEEMREIQGKVDLYNDNWTRGYNERVIKNAMRD